MFHAETHMFEPFLMVNHVKTHISPAVSSHCLHLPPSPPPLPQRRFGIEGCCGLALFAVAAQRCLAAATLDLCDGYWR